MRTSTLVGIGLAIAGAFFLVRGGSFTTRREVMNVGGMRVTAEEQRPILPWVAGAVVVAGLVLAATGLRRRS